MMNLEKIVSPARRSVVLQVNSGVGIRGVLKVHLHKSADISKAKRLWPLSSMLLEIHNMLDT